MSYLPTSRKFLQPGPNSYIRFWDFDAKRFRYERLVDRVAPFIYSRRLASVASAGTSSQMMLREINPSEPKHHRYQAFIGVAPGALFHIFHPSNNRILEWDQSVVEIDADSTRYISYEESPYDNPTLELWVRPERFPSLEAINIMDKTGTPSFIIVAARYTVQEEADIGAEALAELARGNMPASFVSYGGES